MKMMKKRMVDFYISKDIINDGTNGRVEWTFKSQAGTYLSNQNPDEAGAMSITRVQPPPPMGEVGRPTLP
ncbi:hypothetical protein GNQ08_14585 [Paenibacillus macerans]|uniref:Uncharacterized protein n=1 Tax=Paenibacillus macerans TaxID=44252 RepID=A0A6N8EZ72_PAEMA|nr:hypothetical protein [Paenibacillus macerans]MBS5911733.1 hypothetical protein [Paenibacillus macerans]MDU5946035.1 hypothetical protein [Paenibacillus macerans]MUG23621.1 hypothetical protein [Paenibacillus macerans]